MIAAVNTVQEGDAFAGPVGEPQAQRAGIELNRLLDVAGEQEDVRQAPGRDARNVATEWRAAHARAARQLSENSDFSLGEDFAATLISTRLPS